MKYLYINKALSTLLLFFLSVFYSVLAWAQEDKNIDVDINVDKGAEGNNWYMQPWVWIVGGALFILLLVSLLRNGGNKPEK